ncbi:HAMP domain-containing histidine kinase [Aeromicrobium sp. CFBP 8757]|uniref:HAMP domain-containing sensor histidine kinase n=1 Tax=Aeromicrobium sp. CFBP 8757 TaxID=2775288 RepID=UPI00177EC849|nr:HAMP domain-containing sensor histidine kinase [Aeromicrobium sp. CFBP 8757]MBD8607623.1 HAMP domain-containing histidine kinase [Aeromicrobium sp. CFBP 8757]
MTLRRRILLLATGLTALVLVLFAVPLAIALKQSASDRVVRETEYVAQGVADYLTTNAYTGVQAGKYVDRVNERTDTAVTVLLPDGTSVGAALPDDVPDAPDGPRRGDGDEDGDDDRDDLGKVSAPRTERVDGGWLVDIGADSTSGRALVRAFVSDGDVDHEVHERWAVIGGGALALLLVAVVGAEVVSRRLTRPLVATAATATELSAGHLDARAPVSGAREVAQVSTALNQLAGRIEELLASERETIADLSHRLRTPMTAIRLDVEALPDSERSRELARHVAVLERTLTAVIQHARLPRAERDDRSCDAREVLRERVAFWTPLAEDQARDVTVVDPGTAATVGCTADELAAALDALIENVVAHTPEGSALAVVLRRTDVGADIDVVDHGPGIPLGAARRGRSDRGSSGLGLDIARSCAESTGGHLDVLSNDDGSHTVRLVLQAPHSII